MFRIDWEFVQGLEERCLEIARYANQDIDKVEGWSLKRLFSRYSTLARIVTRESPER